MVRRWRIRVLLVCGTLGFSVVACSLLTDYGLPAVAAEAAAPEDATPPDPGRDVAPAPLEAGAECFEKPCVVELAAGGETTCARTDDGAVWCWGASSTGVVGAGAADDFGVPHRVAFDGPVDELSMNGWGSGGDWTTACARRGTSVECWGHDGTDLKLGRGGASAGDFVPVPAPVVGLGPVDGISVGAERVCARLTDAGLACWGRAPTDLQAPRPVKQMVAGREHQCVLLDNEEVACAGFLFSFKENWPDSGTGPGQPEMKLVAGVTGIQQIASLGNVICALKKSGVVLCWGRNKNGQLGRGATSQESEVPAPVALPLSATLIATGDNHGCALLSDGTVWCWGRNGAGTNRDGSETMGIRGQVGALPDGGLDDFTATPRAIAGLPTGTAVRALVGGYAHSCALLKSGAVYCWGSNFHRELGHGDGDGGDPDDTPHPKAERVVF